jgi:hypothetical protein
MWRFFFTGAVVGSSICVACRAGARFAGSRRESNAALTQAFAGIHPRKEHLVVTVKAAGPIRSSRVFKSEQVSKSRWHHEVKVVVAQDIDAELLGWLREAYELCA